MNINNDEKNTIFAAIIQHIGISDALKRKTNGEKRNYRTSDLADVFQLRS